MNQYPHDSDEDQDSLFGSPPPSPARGRSPTQEGLVAGGEPSPIIAAPVTGTGRKNVGTIALPGSHMSCAELPADLPASGLSSPLPTSSHDSSSITPAGVAETSTLVHAPVVTSRSSTRSAHTRASSATSTRPSTSSTKRRRTPKSKSLTPIPPPITLPGPNEPTPQNFLRSQSSLLGLAGLVGCVKPAQLYNHDPKPTPVQQPCSSSLVRGSTPAHPIVLDDEDNPHVGEDPASRLQTPQRLDQLDPEVFRSNIMNALTKEKNIFPVLESLVKLLEGQPHVSSANPPPQPFARPYGYGIFDAQPSLSTPDGSTTATAPPHKRRKLRHVPAGATDWDVPFPFAAGEGPEAYRDTWARDRAKQLVTQLLQLVQNAAKRAAIRTAKSGEVSKGRISARNRQTSRSVSVEAQVGQIGLAQTNNRESVSHASPNMGSVMTGVSMDNLNHYLGLLEVPSMIGPSVVGSKDRMSVESEGAVEDGGLEVPCDCPAFEEWLSQLQQVIPLEANTLTPGSDLGIHSSVPLDSSTSGSTPDILVPMQRAIRDEAVDPALLALSQQSGAAPSSRSPVYTPGPDDVLQVLEVSPTPSARSPRTSSSSLTEPLAPLCGASTDVLTSTVAHQDTDHNPPIHQPVTKDHRLRPADRIRAMASPAFLRESETPHNTTQKGKARADVSVASITPSAPSRPTSQGALDKQGILERARERRRQLVTEIERTKIEIVETTIGNAVLVHLTRGQSL